MSVASEHGTGEHRLTQLPGRVGGGAELLPRRRHQVLLLVLHDQRAEARCGAQAGILVEGGDPRRGAGDRRLRRLATAVDRRPDDGIGAAADLARRRQVEHAGDRGRERRRQRTARGHVDRP
jgi:hypothetical protein